MKSALASSGCWHPLPARAAAEVFEAIHPAAVRDGNNGSEPLVRIASATKLFPVGGGLFRRATRFVHAVDDISLEIGQGEALGLVGESGSGKTTIGRILVRLGDTTSGEVSVRLDGATKSIGDFERATFRRGVQMIFQDPYESLNPRMTIGEIVTEPLDVLQIDSRDARASRVTRMLERVGLTPATTFVHRYPHELSGGQRQRVAIARAMVIEPRLIVADEPTSMLDVSVRAGIMDLLLDLKRDFSVGFLYITHDLAVARYLCDRLAVMYQGKIVELGGTEDVLRHPLHPYTRALIAAVPVPDPAYRRPPAGILGRASVAINPGSQCRFLARCPVSTERCARDPHPPLAETTPAHVVACYEATVVTA